MDYLRTITNAINALTDAGKLAVEAQIREALARSATGNPTDLVEEIVEILEPYLDAITSNAASLSAQSYDLIRYSAVGSAFGAQPYTERTPEATRKAVRGIARYYSDNSEAFVHEILNRVDYEAKRAAGNTIMRNAGKDPSKPRFARVPTGPETCPFCIMLASRGAVYYSEETAGKYNHYHPNCDCRVTPVFDYITVGYGPDTRRIPATPIEDYDPDEYYDQYLDDIASGNLKLTPKKGGKGTAQNYVPTKVLVRDWGGYPGVRDYLSRAKDVIDLDERYKEVMGSFKQSDYADGARKDLQNVVQEVVHIARGVLKDVKKRQKD